VQGNYFHGCGNPVATSEGGAALYCGTFSYDGTICENVVCTGNRFENNKWSHCSFGATGGVFSGNTLLNGGESGFFSNAMSQVAIYGNVINTQTMVDIAASGIELDNARNCQVYGNIVTNCGSDGISIADCQNISVHDNICLNNGQQHATVSAFATASGIGIVSSQASPSGSSHIFVRNNTLIDQQPTHTQQYGVQAFIVGSGYAIDSLVIEGNDCTGCAAGTIFTNAGVIGTNGFQKDNISNTGIMDAPFKTIVIQAPATAIAQSITGAGFKPRAYDISYSLASTGTSALGNGTCDGLSANCSFFFENGTGRASGPAGGYIVNITDSISTVQARATHTSLDVDGMTITWSNVTVQPWMIIKAWR